MTRRASGRLVNQPWSRHSSRKRPLKLSIEPFCIGLPGSMKNSFTPFSLARQREVDGDGRALARAVVLQVGGAEPATVGQAVLGEVERPSLVGGDRAPGACRHAAEPALLAAAAADREL